MPAFFCWAQRNPHEAVMLVHDGAEDHGAVIETDSCGWAVSAFQQADDAVTCCTCQAVAVMRDRVSSVVCAGSDDDVNGDIPTEFFLCLNREREAQQEQQRLKQKRHASTAALAVVSLQKQASRVSAETSATPKALASERQKFGIEVHFVFCHRQKREHFASRQATASMQTSQRHLHGSFVAYCG